MKKPFAVVSDLHFHTWSLFSSDTSDGINSRLQIILDQLVIVANELRYAGGDLIVCAGDIFHVRGSIKPSVLNPVMDKLRMLRAEGFELQFISGNHDLETHSSTDLSSAATALRSVGVKVINEPQIDYAHHIAYIPWIKDTAGVLAASQALADELKSNCLNPHDFALVLHAPLNGVIKGIPDTGVDPKDLETPWGVALAGHYHNHKMLAPNVYSIGALTHQTWSDVDSLAGYLLVDRDRSTGAWEVCHFQSTSPKFMDFDAGYPHTSAGNYVRVKLKGASEEDIRRIREAILTDYGAAGVVVHSEPVSKVTPRSATSKGVTLIESVETWVTSSAAMSALDHKRVLSEASDILAETDV